MSRFTDAVRGATFDRIVCPIIFIRRNISCVGAGICCAKGARIEIHDSSVLRQSLSDELHARAFYDFDGAGRFIRFVYLVGIDYRVVLNYENDHSKP